MRISLIEGGLYSLMIGLGETYLVAYALCLGVSESEASYLGIVPIVLGGFIQFALSFLARNSKSLRMWLCACAGGQALVLLTIALLGLFGPRPVSVMWLGSLASLYWAFGFTAGPIWNFLLVRSIDPSIVNHFFYQRNAVNQISSLLGLVLAGMVLHNLHVGADGSVELLSLLLIIAGLVRIGSGILFLYHPFKVDQAPPPMNRPGFSAWLLKPFILPSLFILFFTNLGVYVAAPFFSPYMLKELGLSLTNYNILLGAALVSRTVAGYVFNGIVVRSGSKVLLAAGTLLISPLPFLWTLTDSFYWLLFFQVIAGLAWGAQELGLILGIIDNVPEAFRSRLLVWSNFITGIGAASGVLIGSFLIEGGDISLVEFRKLFNTSALLRVLPFIIILFLIKNVKGRPILFRILGVRVNGRILTKPILLPKYPKTKKSRAS